MSYPTPPQPTINKVLGVKLRYIDPFGTRETLLVFGCEINLPANYNAAMSGQFEVTVHTSAGDCSYTISAPYGGSNLP